MSYFTKSPKIRSPAKPRIVACKLDSKARLVLPLCIREKLSVAKGETVLFEIEFSGGKAFLQVSKSAPKGLKRSSKNGWESWA
ncbi:MAG TPA: hypothetical protein VJI71_03165 [Candidatus Norongarragalinales archaeon]|nr:hypothetical protein [Candidatus Norongarragalinales archaeon]